MWVGVTAQVLPSNAEAIIVAPAPSVQVKGYQEANDELIPLLIVGVALFYILWEFGKLFRK